MLQIRCSILIFRFRHIQEYQNIFRENQNNPQMDISLKNQGYQRQNVKKNKNQEGKFPSRKQKRCRDQTQQQLKARASGKTSRGEKSFKLIFNAICKHSQMPDDSYNGSSMLKRSPACALNTHTVLLCEICLTNLI